MTHTAEGSFNPSYHFLGLIQKAMADGVVRRCSVPGSPEVYIVPEENLFYTSTAHIEDLESLCLAPPFDLKVEALPEWHRGSGKEVVQIGRMWMRKQASNAPSGLSAHPLSELLWYATVRASAGQLLQGCRTDEPIRLKRWPDLSVLYRRDSYTTLAAFMLEESADLATIADATGTPINEVCDFHNGCAVLGLIERGNTFEPREYLLGLIQRAMADQHIRRCLLPGLPPLFIVPAEGRYYTNADNTGLHALCSAMLIDIQVEIVDSVEGGEEEEELVQIGRMWKRRKKEGGGQPKLPSRSLAELLFRATLGASRGRLLAGNRNLGPVKLKRWPEAFCFEQDRRFFPLTAFMAANAAPLTTIAERTGVPMTRVIDFYNACAVLNLIDHPETEQIRARRIADRERELYRKISQALVEQRQV